MQKAISELNEIIEKYHLLLQQVEEKDFSKKLNPEKWSKKEELGHIVDSAQNNIQRFIRVQYEENVHIMYHPDNWVVFNDYQNRDVKELIELWYLLNKQIVTILQRMPVNKQEALMCFDKDASVRNTTLFVAEDYVKHMKHHLEHITSK
ncbi:MAG: DinB family protein [Chitinophagales bacterium]